VFAGAGIPRSARLIEDDGQDDGQGTLFDIDESGGGR